MQPSPACGVTNAEADKGAIEWCRLRRHSYVIPLQLSTFSIDGGPPKVEWRVRIWNASPPDAQDKIICGDQSIAPPGYRTATLGKPVTFVLDTRHGWACNMPMQLGYSQAERSNGFRVHTVVAGDSLTKLAKVYLGNASRYMEIFKANPGALFNPDVIRVGQRLNTPAK